MPVYVYGCPQCGVFERHMRVADHSRVVACECGEDAKQIITAPTVIIPSHMSATGVSTYESPATGRLITNQRERRNDLAESGCIEYDPGMKQDADRRVVEDEKRLESMVDETIDREIAAMPTVKRELLANEMSRGVTAEVERI